MFPPGVPLSKRLFDLLLTIPGLVIISPLLLVISLLVWFFLGSPVLFRQARGGYRGNRFEVLKFRSMTDRKDHQGNLLPDAERLTRFGRFLRSTSLDELPELFNVMRGEMSLVGPRPLFAKYLDRYTAEQARRHEMLPGIAGWAQVNGRNALTWEDKFNLDVWYVDHWSLGLDVKILFMTFWKAFRREGISQPGHATAEEFLGSVAHENLESSVTGVSLPEEKNN
jgi:sugar transferase EpsL